MFHPSSSSAPNNIDLSMHHAVVNSSSAVPTAPAEIPRAGFFHGDGGLLALPNIAASAPPPYPSSLPSSYYIHSNTNSHFLPLHLNQLSEHLNGNATLSCSSPSASACQLPLPRVPSSPSSPSRDLLEFSAGAMRRVFSTGDLRVTNAAASPPPLSGDPHDQGAAGGPFAHKVGRYSAEERREKIERYRTKRNQRNFHKKITYACRKTLADSRPRVQGRFARNAEAEAFAGHEREAEYRSYEHRHCHYSDLTATTTTSSCCCCNAQCRESGKTTATFDDGNWWWETPVAAPAAAANGEHHGHHHQYQQQLLGFDADMDMDGEDLWACLADMCSGT